jgi:hypothetical protein
MLTQCGSTYAMKLAKQRTLKPRNRLAAAPLLRKGGAHLRVDKRASRARQKAQAARSRRATEEC